ncbi:MAG: nucleotidyltransferase [Methylococcales bacterium]|jgi:hypothetical protein|nr:nucleotidyltransferase [Methylococcales bacterium]
MSKHPTIRIEIAQEAARLMYDEDVKQYLDAKRLAAKRLFGKSGQQNLRYNPKDLPSNGEIQAALKALILLYEGEDHFHRLYLMRKTALKIMQQLSPFNPRLIGSVSTGHIREGSDIDLHVFTDDLETLLRHLDNLGWQYDLDEVAIKQGNKVQLYTHVYFFLEYPIELSVYDTLEIRVTQRSSTDGKPIKRLKPKALIALIEAEHPELVMQHDS